MAIAGRLLNESSIEKQELAPRALEFITDDGLILEGRPHNYITAKGCRPVD